MKILININSLSTSHATSPVNTNLNLFRRFAVVLANFPHLQSLYKSASPEEADALLERLFKQEEARLSNKSTKR